LMWQPNSELRRVFGRNKARAHAQCTERAFGSVSRVFPSLGKENTADLGFRIHAKRFADGTLSFAFRILRLRFKHEPWLR